MGGRARGAAGIIIIIIPGSGHGQLLRAVLLNYFRKTDIAKNVVLRWELASFPYGASAVLRSSVVALGSLGRQLYVFGFLIYFRKTVSF